MKKVLFTTSAFLMCFFISCKDESTTSTSSTNSQTDKNLANNRRVMKAIETGDAATIDSLIANDAVDHQGPNGMDIKGGDSVKHMLSEMHNHVKDLKFDVIADAANGDYIFSLSHMTGTTSDASWGMPAGTKMDEKGVDVIKVKDGKMVEHWGFVDPNEMMKHMKDMPPMDHKMDKKMDDKMMDKKMDTTKKM